MKRLTFFQKCPHSTVPVDEHAKSLLHEDDTGNVGT